MEQRRHLRRLHPNALSRQRHAADPALATARRTEWTQHGDADEGWMLGAGQRMFTAGDADVAVMDLRNLRLGRKTLNRGPT